MDGSIGEFQKVRYWNVVIYFVSYEQACDAGGYMVVMDVQSILFVPSNSSPCISNANI